MENAATLLLLARKRFKRDGRLNKAERRMIRNSALGKETTLDDLAPMPDMDADIADWPPERHIRAEVLRWLLVEPEAHSLIGPQGIFLERARIIGPLKLAFSTINHPIICINCFFTDSIDLACAAAPLIALTGCDCRDIFAPLLTVANDLKLDLLNCSGTITLRSARIHGELDLCGATLHPTDGAALRANGICIGSGLFLRPRQGRRFTAIGDIQLAGSTISGELSLCGAQLTATQASNGVALSAHHMKVEGNITTCPMSTTDALTGTDRLYALETLGELQIIAAHVMGQIEFIGTTLRAFDARRPRTLTAERVKCNGSVIFRTACIDIHGAERTTLLFDSTGEIRFLGAHVGGQMLFIGVQLRTISSDNPCVFCADGMTVDRGVQFKNDEVGHEHQIITSSCLGQIRMAGALIRGDLVLGNTKIDGRNLRTSDPCLHLMSAQVQGRFIVRSNKEIAYIHGGVRLDHAHIHLLDDDSNAWNYCTAIDLDGLVYDRLSDRSAREPLRRVKEWIEKPTWGAEDGQYTFRPQPYEQLAKTLRAAGHADEAREVLIAKEDARHNYTQMTRWRRAWHGFLGASIGYGYRPLLAFKWLFITWVLGTAVYTAAMAAGAFAPTAPLIYYTGAYQLTEEGLPRYSGLGDEPREYPRFFNLAYSADVLLPIVNLRQEDYWIPRTTGPGTWRSAVGWIAYVYMWLHILAGWIFTTLFVLGFTGLVRPKD